MSQPEHADGAPQAQPAPQHIPPVVEPQVALAPSGDRRADGGLIANWNIVLWASARYPTAYMQISKAGCTFAKNFLWHLDHGRPHPARDRIHDISDALPQIKPRRAEDLADRPRSFVILRDPMERFLSLYFDKVVGPGHVNFLPLRQRLIDRRGLDPDPQTIQAHRRNCHLTLDWIADTWSREVWMPPNRHWAKQMHRFLEARQVHLYVLTLNDVSRQLRLLLRDVVPDIDRHLAANIAKNRSRRAVATQELVDDRLRARLAELYPGDLRIYAEAQRRWQAVDGHDDAPVDALPRAHQFA